VTRTMTRRGWLTVGLAAALTVGLASPVRAQPNGSPVRPPVDDDGLNKPLFGRPDLAGLPTTAELRNEADAARDAMATAGGADLATSAALDLGPCESDPAFLCGTLPVPLDRRNPDGRTIGLHVEVFPHTGAQPEPGGAVFITEGGPGFSVSLDAKYGYAFFLLPEVAETRDLVFVDQRGVGLSDAIVCPDLQAGGPTTEALTACHDQLGDTANLYSTTDVADDLEDLRQALGYGKIDVVGGSYAGNDAITYAVRHTDNVRSIAVGSPAVDVEGANRFPFDTVTPQFFPGFVSNLCGRSPACATAHPDPAGNLAWLAARLRRRPVTGTGIDSHGVPHQVTVTETLLAKAIMFFNGASFVGPGEIVQAAEALRHGDKVPLLRLASDADPASHLGFGDPREFSGGHLLARLCVDFPEPWDKDAEPAVRQAQYAAALAAQPDFFGPFSRDGWVGSGFLIHPPFWCLASAWEDRPARAPGTTVTGVPALVVGGEYDVPEFARLATDVLVGAEFVTLAAAGHVPWWYSNCGPELVQRFIMTGTAGDTSCAGELPAGWWMPGSFPKTTAKAPPAVQTGGPAAPRRIRRLATVVAWTVLDGIQHNFSIPDPVSVSLRGGTITREFVEELEAPRLTFDRARFTRDVAVSGAVTWTDVLDGQLTVKGPHRRTISAHINGPFITPGQDVTITLDVRGEPATFTVPGY
jgi:pimeloyl-ACP methyl ester carboxylesterase